MSSHVWVPNLGKICTDKIAPLDDTQVAELDAAKIQKIQDDLREAFSRQSLRYAGFAHMIPLFLLSVARSEKGILYTITQLRRLHKMHFIPWN